MRTLLLLSLLLLLTACSVDKALAEELRQSLSTPTVIEHLPIPTPHAHSHSHPEPTPQSTSTPQPIPDGVTRSYIETVVVEVFLEQCDVWIFYAHDPVCLWPHDD